VDRAWAGERLSRGRLSELETAVNPTPTLQCERGVDDQQRVAPARGRVQANIRWEIVGIMPKLNTFIA